MKNAESRTLWVLYHTGCWHAWREGFDRSVCGLVRGPRTEGRVRDVRRRPPDGGVCRTCRRRMAQAHSETHRNGPGCACQPCRAERRWKAREAVRAVRTEIHRLTCACIRRAVLEEGPPWGAVGRSLAEAERAVATRLVLWEVSGEAGVEREAEEARRRFLARWKAAARQFRRQGLRHTCRIGRA